ncbi:MAG: PAS domain-containing protein [Anaerolineae bacterium]|nr:PAS domain-containing protein [Anaerolineae bacterium]
MSRKQSNRSSARGASASSVRSPASPRREVTAPITVTSADEVAAMPASLSQADETRAALHFYDLARLSLDMFWEMDAAGVYLYCSERVRDVLGYTPAEMLARTFFDLLLDEDSPEAESGVVEKVHALLAEGREFQIEACHIAKDGRAVLLLVTGSPVVDANGHIHGYRGFSRDVTAQRDLEARHMLLRQALDLNPNFFFIRDREGRFILANRAIADAYGTTVEDLVGKTDADFNADPEELETIRRGDLEVMESRQDKFIPESPILRRGRWVQTTKLPLVDADGVARQVLGISSDITERVQMEQAIQTSLERRGRQVQTSTEVAQEIAAAAALDELFERVVTLVKERFGYYHAQIFRYDASTKVMRLVVGYGLVGARMLAIGHAVSMGRGVVGAAASTGRPMLAPDVTRDPDWVPNTFLPGTRGELAVPIKLRDQILGILDVQSNITNALTQEDQLLLEGLCGQIAIAIHNTQLLEAANTFRQVIASSGQGITLATLDGTLTYVNPAFCALVGASDPQSLVGQSFFSYYPKALHTRLRKEILPALMKHGQWQGELAVLTRTGAEMPTLENLAIVADESLTGERGEPRYLIRQVSDITARKAMEEALAMERHLLHALLDNVPDHVYFKDLESRFLRISTANARWLNVTDPSVVLGKTDFDYFASEHANKALADEKRILKTGKPLLNVEEKEVWPDGRVTWVSTSKMPLHDATGNIIGTFGVSTDITARKLAEMERERLLAEMEEQAEQLRSIVEDMTIIQETMTALTAALTFDEAVDILMQSTVAALKADRVSMFLLDGERLTRVGIYPADESQRARIGEVILLADYPLTRQVIEARRLMAVTVDSPELQEHARGSFLAGGIFANATTPLIGREGVVGTLVVSFATPERDFTDHDKRMLQMLADQTTLSFENIRLLERMRARVERERQVRAMTDKIRRGADRDAIMRATLQELGQMFDAPEAIIRLGTPERLLVKDADPPAG